jgi:hypothetical protein
MYGAAYWDDVQNAFKMDWSIDGEIIQSEVCVHVF